MSDKTATLLQPRKHRGFSIQGQHPRNTACCCRLRYAVLRVRTANVLAPLTHPIWCCKISYIVIMALACEVIVHRATSIFRSARGAGFIGAIAAVLMLCALRPAFRIEFRERSLSLLLKAKDIWVQKMP